MSGVVTQPQRRPDPKGTVLRLAPEPSDDVLVGRALEGDRDAVEWLVRRHAPRVTRVLCRILGGDPDLVDHAQEVLIRAVQELDKLRDPSAFRAWATALAVTEAQRVLRKRARWRWLFRAQIEVDVPEDVDDEGREALRAVYDVLARLTAEERTLFALRYLEGMELTEVAASTGMSLATLKRRLSAVNRRFVVFAASQPALTHWLSAGRFAPEEGP